MRDFYSAPCLIDMTITKKCNLKCDYCCVESSPDINTEEELSVDEFKILFKEFDELNVHRISLSGGEPFIRSDFFEILEEALKYKFAVVINTNGTLITDEIAKKLSKYKFDRICVTLDGSMAEIHEYFRGKGTFKKTLEGIKSLQKYGVNVSTLFTLNKININNLIDCIKFNENLGIDYMSVMVLCPTGRAKDGKLLINKETWYPIFMKLTNMLLNDEIKLNFKIVPPNESQVFWLYYFPLEYYNKLNLLSLWGQNIENKNFKRELSCQAGIAACYINSFGKVYGCELISSMDEFIAGNIRYESFKDIWNNSEVFNKLRKIKFKDINGKCSKCPHEWCGAGCRSTALNLGKDIYSSDESCFYEI